MSYLWIFPGVMLAWILSNLVVLLNNYLEARKSGFPLVVWPINPNAAPWMIFSVPLRPVLQRVLPQWALCRISLSIYGWEGLEKNRPFDRWGRCFIFVTCGRNELAIADPDLAYEVLRRPRDFVQTDIASKIIGVFGGNLLTADGDSWARQRKFIAPNINERISNTVFRESCRQTLQMLENYVDDCKGVTDDIMDALKTIAINVLGVAGYGVSRSWKQVTQDIPDGYQLSYIEATRLVVDHVVEAALIPANFLLFPFMPRVVQKIGHAIREFPQHTKAMLEAERRIGAEDDGKSRNNILSMLVRGTQGGKHELGLSEDEIMGNLFVFTAAGFDTTANTMTYAITLLAAHPEWQDWIIDEIDEVLKDKPDELDYAEVYPKLTRCLMLMHETLRLFTPLTHIAKMTSAQTTLTCPTSKKIYHIAPKTTIYISGPALHNSPAIWGPDVDAFLPSRWLTTSPETGRPALKTMPRGTFVPWSAGPRVCPGSKMSQVEFVSVFMTIFRRFRVEAVRRGKTESMQECTERLERCMQDSQPRVTQQMNRPNEVVLQFVRREVQEAVERGRG